MCLIVFAWQQHADFPLVLAANRDEFHARPTEPMGWWTDPPDILGGRDLQAGGSWLAVSRDGRIAAVTNVREKPPAAVARSRGEIVTRFATNREPAGDFVSALPAEEYAGFNALLGDRDGLCYVSNRDPHSARPLTAGTYGLSNASLDTPWDKLLRTKHRLADVVGGEDLTLDHLLDLIGDREPASDMETSGAGLPAEIARAASAPFIVTPNYGTRCSTALIWRRDGHVEIAERRFDASGDLTGESRFVFIAE